jgi:hypothetical protein
MELNIYVGLLLTLCAVLIIGGVRLIGQIIDERAERAKARRRENIAKLMDPRRNGWDD